MRRAVWDLVAGALPVALSMVAVGASAQPREIQAGPVAPAAYREAVDRSRGLIEEWRVANRVPGASAAVAVDGRVVWSEGYGWADLEQHVPVTPVTRFRLGSVSKMFTAVALTKLAEAGRIDLNAPVRRYLPDFPEKEWPITARQLSAHTAGIRHYRDEDFAIDAPIGRNDHFLTDRSALTVFEDDPLEFQPGTRASYSTYGYSLLAATLAAAAGTSYQQVVHDLISLPLGLRSVGADHPYHLVPDRSRFYVYREDVGATINAGFTDNSYKWAGGGFLATSEDLARFASALLEPGFLSAASLDLMFTPQTLENGELAETGGAPVGIGWRVDRDDAGRRRFHHGGSQTGGGAILLMLADEKVSVAILTNQLPRPTEELAQRIADLFAAAR